MPTLYGYRVCDCIIQSIPGVEKDLHEAGLLTGPLPITQGCYSTAVKESGLTHAGGGVLDVSVFTPYKTEVDVLLTSRGWLISWRTVAQGFKIDHGHIVLNGCPHLSQQAHNQLIDFLHGRNGLQGHGKDTGPLPSLTWQQAITRNNSQKDDDMELITIYYDAGPDPKDGIYASTAIIHATTGWVQTSNGYGSRAELDAWKASAGSLGMTITERHVNKDGWLLSQRFHH